MVFSYVPELGVKDVMICLSDVILDIKEEKRRQPVSGREGAFQTEYERNGLFQ